MSCSFCNSNGKKSREHIYSNIVLRFFDDIAPVTFDPIRNTSHGSDPIIKDICKICNEQMSYLDTYAGIMARKYCAIFQLPGNELVFDSNKLKKWCLKTSSNMERSFGRNRNWWKNYWRAFVNEGHPLDESLVSIFVGAWANKSPVSYPEALEAAKVKVLDFVDANVIFLKSAESGHMPEHLYALKIGSLVFLCCIWNSDGKNHNLINELESYGWELLTDKTKVRRIPFNSLTCEHIGFVINPSKFFKEGKIIDIPDGFEEDLEKIRQQFLSMSQNDPKRAKLSKK